MCSALQTLNRVIKKVPLLMISGAHDLRSGPTSVGCLNLTDAITRQTWASPSRQTIGSVEYSSDHTNVTHVTILNAGHMVTLPYFYLFHFFRTQEEPYLVAAPQRRGKTQAI